VNLHYNGEITLGNIITLVAAGIAVLTAWKDIIYRVKNLEAWRKEHSDTLTTVAAATVEIKEAVVQLKQIAAGQDRRIIMLEEKRP
jgi:hypothetical protein